MTIFSDRLRSLRDDKRLTVDEVASEVGISRSTLSNYETGARYPKKPILDAILDYYNVSLDYLEGKTDVKNVYDFNGIYNAGYKEGLTDAAGNVLKSTPVPIYSPLSCGTGTWVNEAPDDYLGIPTVMIHDSVSYFANPAQGNSMEPHIKNGDYLIFEKTEQIDSGKIGSFSLNGQYYCKRFKRLADGSAWLFSDNGDYEPIPIYPEDDFRTLGLYRFKLSKEQ